MSRTTLQRTIHAPVDVVFRTISDIHNFQKAVPDIVNVEILSETDSRVGTRFRETRMMGKREATADLEITEYVENDRIRLVSEVHGTTWSSLFSVTPSGSDTTLHLVTDAQASGLISGLLLFLTKGIVKKALEKDLDAVKAYCEGAAT